jgi:NADH:ubiquinone oxidoreductase subunit F (NADH-binding)
VRIAGGFDGTPYAFSPGGAATGFLPIAERHRPLDCSNLARVGTTLGSAGVVVLNDTVDIALAVRWQLAFFEEESCGQCTPCRIGTRYLRRQLDDFLREGDPAALARTDEVTWEMEQASICGLGMTAAIPLTSARRFFPQAFARRAPLDDGGDG